MGHGDFYFLLLSFVCLSYQLPVKLCGPHSSLHQSGKWYSHGPFTLPVDVDGEEEKGHRDSRQDTRSHLTSQLTRSKTGNRNEEEKKRRPAPMFKVSSRRVSRRTFFRVFYLRFSLLFLLLLFLLLLGWLAGCWRCFFFFFLLLAVWLLVLKFSFPSSRPGTDRAP